MQSLTGRTSLCNSWVDLAEPQACRQMRHDENLASQNHGPGLRDMVTDHDFPSCPTVSNGRQTKAVTTETAEVAEGLVNAHLPDFCAEVKCRWRRIVNEDGRTSGHP